MTDDQDYWMNKKMPAGSTPLTREWYKMVTTPRYDQHGNAFYMLTPPSDDLPLGRMIGGTIVGVIVLVIAVLTLIGTASSWMK